MPENAKKQYHIPRYDEFPDIDLYMDQIITYLNKHLSCFSKDDGDILTPTMINNYVKHGIIPAPEGKRYTRRHLAYIVAVFFLKQVLRMDEIKKLISFHIKQSDEHQAYEMFCAGIEEAFSHLFVIGQREYVGQSDGILSIKYAAIAMANKAFAQKSIEKLVVLYESEACGKEKTDKEKTKNDKEKVKKEKTKKEKPEKEKKDKLTSGESS